MNVRKLNKLLRNYDNACITLAQDREMYFAFPSAFRQCMLVQSRERAEAYSRKLKAFYAS